MNNVKLHLDLSYSEFLKAFSIPRDTMMLGSSHTSIEISVVPELDIFLPFDDDSLVLSLQIYRPPDDYSAPDDDATHRAVHCPIP